MCATKNFTDSLDLANAYLSSLFSMARRVQAFKHMLYRSNCSFARWGRKCTSTRWLIHSLTFTRAHTLIRRTACIRAARLKRRWSQHSFRRKIVWVRTMSLELELFLLLLFLLSRENKLNDRKRRTSLTRDADILCCVYIGTASHGIEDVWSIFWCELMPSGKRMRIVLP